ncbi:putative ABC transport system ATP-binding protein [Bowdeniella nasicola]|uniref:Putative ABC transport system ATP-binding protein n=1 Tax=Bowdeniella nasicola TaxID=208480 RepID=A0A1H3Y1T2_9ACTO|nr:ABC transporter ATP-binding protein [Bowdeniella nasicola]SEA05695.1 putative ABC transport system ATP-binding protein [Bowdeniella nasicola]
MSSISAAIRAENLTKIYGSGDAAVRAVDNVSVAIEAGEFTSVMGPSGSGKSTFLHCVAGLDSVTSGRVQIAGEDITAMSDAQLSRFRRDRIGFVFQAFNLLPTMTAQQNIVLPTKMARKSVDQAWFDQLIETLGLAERLDHRPYELSGGQQQRVAVARALLTRPAVLIADEPTGNLDSASSAEVLQLLRSAVDDLDQAVLMVTHDPNAAGVGDRILSMADGVIVSDERPGHSQGRRVAE